MLRNLLSFHPISKHEPIIIRSIVNSIIAILIGIIIIIIIVVIVIVIMVIIIVIMVIIVIIIWPSAQLGGKVIIALEIIIFVAYKQTFTPPSETETGDSDMNMMNQVAL